MRLPTEARRARRTSPIATTANFTNLKLNITLFNTEFLDLQSVTDKKYGRIHFYLAREGILSANSLDLMYYYVTQVVIEQVSPDYVGNCLLEFSRSDVTKFFILKIFMGKLRKALQDKRIARKSIF